MEIGRSSDKNKNAQFLFITTMTSRKKVQVSSFGHVLSTHGRDAFAHQISPQIALSNSKLLTFFKIQGGGRHHLGFTSRVHLEHSVMLIAWCLSSV